MRKEGKKCFLDIFWVKFIFGKNKKKVIGLSFSGIKVTASTTIGRFLKNQKFP